MEKLGGSRLMQMQAKFQQKQMQERELKIASLYEAQQARALERVRNSPSNGASPALSTPLSSTVSHQPGKVRQMFEERRTKAGIDKSYPLQPIHNTERTTAPRRTVPNGHSKVITTKSRETVERRAVKAHMTNTTHTMKNQTQVLKVENFGLDGSGDLNHNYESDENSNTKHTHTNIPQNNGEMIAQIDEVDKPEDNSYLLENETFPETLAPTPTPHSPALIENKKTIKKAPMHPKSPVRTKPQTSSVVSPRKTPSQNTGLGASRGHAGSMQRGANPVPKRNPVSSPQISKTTARSRIAGSMAQSAGSAPSATGSAGAGEPCRVCGRRFASDRIVKHQEICAKSSTKKRKPFDVLKHRLAGTEAEPFINKLRKGNNTSQSKVNKTQNSSWRQKHEEFIQAIRAAKEVQQHLKSGGKLSDLPPPPPSENPDYVQCPHCNRRFNQGAAERHIPKCANYQFNKRKPTTTKRR